MNFKDPKGTEIITIAVIGGYIAYQGILHLYLANEANQIDWNGDGFGRKRHCYVNCKSVRYNLGNPGPALFVGYVKEGINMFQYAMNGDLSFGADDSLGDIRANHQGIFSGYLFWIDCKILCENCQ